MVLNEIIDGAASVDVPLAVLLRKSLVLAFRLNNEALKDWCAAELNGYSEDALLPDYRVFDCHSLGFFVGFGGSTMDRQPLALGVLSEEHQQVVRNVTISSGVAELATLAAGPTTQTLSSPWSPNMTVIYQRAFYNGWVLNRAWREFPAARLAGICDTVRNKLLRLALELRGQAGDSDSALSQIAPAQVEAKVVNYIYGGQNVIGSTVGRDVAQASGSGVIQGDRARLHRSLLDHGVSAAEIEALDHAMEQDGGKLGEKTKDWIKRLSETVGGGLAVETITAVLKAFFGTA